MWHFSLRPAYLTVCWLHTLWHLRISWLHSAWLPVHASWLLNSKLARTVVAPVLWSQARSSVELVFGYGDCWLKHEPSLHIGQSHLPLPSCYSQVARECLFCQPGVCKWLGTMWAMLTTPRTHTITHNPSFMKTRWQEMSLCLANMYLLVIHYTQSWNKLMNSLLSTDRVHTQPKPPGATAVAQAFSKQWTTTALSQSCL